MPTTHDVKAQFTTGSRLKPEDPEKPKNTIDSTKQLSPVQLKHGILKSLILASLILCLEVVLYLAWPI